MGLKQLLAFCFFASSSAWAQTVTHGTGTIHDNDSSAAPTFAQRCAAPGVINCVSFDTVADFNQGAGGNQGAWGDRAGLMPDGNNSYANITRDTTTFKSGTSSLRFTIPPVAAANTSGSWFTNFKSDLSAQVGEGQEVYIQWRQRFSPGLLSTIYKQADGVTPANGWKLADVSAGDKPTCSLATASSTLCPTTCWDFETVLQDSNQNNVPQMYANCTGAFPYAPMNGFTSNVTVQNVVNCLYPSYVAPPCVKFFANEWMTFQIHIKVGTWNTWSSTIQLWVARDGGASVLVIDCSPTATNKCTNFIDSSANNGWYLNNSDTSYKFGKVWFLPYHTQRSAAFTYTTEFTWYDDLVVSSQPIADPQ